VQVTRVLTSPENSPKTDFNQETGMKWQTKTISNGVLKAVIATSSQYKHIHCTDVLILTNIRSTNIFL